jgi:hypothetical protein
MFGKYRSVSIRLFNLMLIAGLALGLAGPVAAQSVVGIGQGTAQSGPSAALEALESSDGLSLAGLAFAKSPVKTGPSQLVPPVFGLALAPNGSLLVADAGSGVVELRKGSSSLVAALPGVSDIAPIGRGDMFAVTGGGDPVGGWRLFRVSHGSTREIANLLDFETNVNPDGGEIDSNPFDVARLTEGRALVADAGGNDLLIVGSRGTIDLVATLPDQIVPTDNVKNLIGCPDAPPDLADICALPEMIPAQAVATSVAIGPDGAYYVGELKGFPFPLGMSRIWRIEPGTRHAQCGVSPACTVVADGFTSIVDLTFGPDGKLYVVEMDEASSGAVELAVFFGLPSQMAGGTVNVCDPATWSCSEVATGLNMPIAAAVNRNGKVFVATNVLLPEVEVISLP